MLFWVKILRPKSDTNSIVARCEWRWPPVSCRPQHETAAGPRPRVCKGSNLSLLHFCKCLALFFPYQAHTVLCFPFPGRRASWEFYPPAPNLLLRHSPHTSLTWDCLWLSPKPPLILFPFLVTTPILLLPFTEYILGRDWFNNLF